MKFSIMSNLQKHCLTVGAPVGGRWGPPYRLWFHIIENNPTLWIHTTLVHRVSVPITIRQPGLNFISFGDTPPPPRGV